MPDRSHSSKFKGNLFYLRFPVVLAASIFFGIWFQQWIFVHPSVLIFTATSATVLAIVFNHQANVFKILLIAIACCAGAYLYSIDSTAIHRSIAHKQIVSMTTPAQFSGKVLNPNMSPAHDGRNRFFGKLTDMQMRQSQDVNGKNFPGSVYISGLTDRDMVHGSQITVEGTLTLPKMKRNFFSSSQADRWMRRDIVGSLSDADILEVHPPKSFVFKIRNRIERRLNETLSAPSAAIAQALFLGSQSDLDYEDRMRIADSGLLHLFAISGFHIGIIGGILMLILGRLIPNLVFRYGLTSALLVGYGMMVGWRPSVLRAVLMFVLFLISKLTLRKPDYLNITSLAAVIVLIVDPDQLFLPGFQLSFAAVYGLVLWLNRIVPPTKRKIPTVFEWMRLSGASSCVAWAATLPIALYWFGQANAMAPVWNLFTAPLAIVLTLLSMCHSLSLIVFQDGIGWVAWTMEAAANIFYKWVNFIAEIPLGVIFSPKPNPISCVLYYLILQVLLSMRSILPFTRWLGLTCVSTAFLMCWSVQSSWDRVDRVIFMDAGQADATLFRFADGQMMLVDTGKPYQPNMVNEGIVPILKHYGKKYLDAVVISHPQFDHAGALRHLMKRVEVGLLITSGDQSNARFWTESMQIVKDQNIPIYDVQFPDEVLGLEDVKINVLHPPRYFSGSLNDRSVVLLISTHNRKVLMTGDLGPKGIQELMFDSSLSHVDVLKIPHHGADFKDAGWDFLRQLKPDITVMSLAQQNRYGHPRANTLQAIGAYGGDAYRTDQNGAVQIDLETLRVQVVDN